MIHRRDLLRQAGAALAIGAFPTLLRADDKPKKKLLVYTRSQTFEHSVVRPAKGKKQSLVDEVMTSLGARHGFDVTCTKDGRIFLPETLKQFDAFFFETTGDLTREGGDKQPPMPPEGKKAFLEAIKAGKGFIGAHCASDTFHSPGHFNGDFKTQATLDPYIEMLGGEFIRHGAQQKAWMRVVDKSFPGLKGVNDFEMMEEWYSLKHFAPDIHVLLVQDTNGMKGLDYERPNFPATWIRKHGQGNVFYTSMGHREDVWESAVFQRVLTAGIAWAFREYETDTTANVTGAAPRASDLPKVPAPETPKPPKK